MKITSITPNVVKPGDQLTIELEGAPEGINPNNMTVLLCNMATLEIEELYCPNGNCRLVVRVGKHSHSGAIQVCVQTTPELVFCAKSEEMVTVEHNDNRPTISGISPDSIENSQNIVTLTGQNFHDIQFIRCGSVMIYEFIVSKNSEIKFQLPLHLIQNGDHQLAVNSQKMGSFYSPMSLNINAKS